MRRVRPCALLGLLLLVASVSSEAGEVVFRLENRLGGDSNVFRRPTRGALTDPVEDGFYELAPAVILREENTELDYDFRYEPVYQTFFDQGKVDGIDHYQRGSAIWSISPRTEIGLSENFSRTRNLRQSASDLDQDGRTDRDVNGGFIVDESDRERVTRTSASVFVSRQWTPVFFQRVSFDFDDVEFNTNRNLDSRSFGLNSSFNYVPVERWSVGVALLGRLRQTEGLLEGEEDNTGVPPSPGVPGDPSYANDREIPREQAYITNIAATLAYKVTPTVDLSVQVGPTLIWSKQLGSDTEFDQSVFATAEAKKTWQRGFVRLNYSRTESGGSGDGSVIIDSARLTATHSPFRHLAVSGILVYSNQESTSSSRTTLGIRRGIKIESYSVIGSLRYRLAENIFLKGEATFRDVRQGGAFARVIAPGVVQTRTDTVRIFSGFVSLEYTFEPWIF